jgi:hypothetical protein
MEVTRSEQTPKSATEERKAYRSPNLTVYGSVESITQGSGIGLKDFVVYGLSDVIGNCKNNSCVIS